MKTPRLICRLAASLAACTILLSAPRARAEDDTGYGILIAPYAWALDVSGTVGLNGMAVPLDLQSTELLRGVKRGGMGYLQWNTGKGFFYFEGLQIDFGQKHFQPFFNQSVDVSLGMGELGYGWTFDVDTRFPVPGTTQISPYLGARAIKLEVGVAGPLLNQDVEESWIDPVLGVIVQGPLSRNLSYVLKLDASGFDAGDNDYRSAAAMLRYAFNRHSALALGYRLAHFETEATGSGLTLDLKGKGPLVGLQITY